MMHVIEVPEGYTLLQWKLNHWTPEFKEFMEQHATECENGWLIPKDKWMEWGEKSRKDAGEIE